MTSQTVLAIDNDPSICWLLKEILKLAGVPHSVTGSGTEGIRLADRDRPALAIVDVKLNGTDGIGVARAITAVSPGTRILFLTGYGDTIRSNVRQDELPHILVEKPFDLGVLLEIIRGACRTGAAGQEQAAAHQTATSAI